MKLVKNHNSNCISLERQRDQKEIISNINDPIHSLSATAAEEAADLRSVWPLCARCAVTMETERIVLYDFLRSESEVSRPCGSASLKAADRKTKFDKRKITSTGFDLKV